MRVKSSCSTQNACYILLFLVPPPPRKSVLYPNRGTRRTKSTGRDGVPSRPEAERPRAERPRVPNPFAGGFGMGAGWGGFPGMEGVAPGAGVMAGGQVQFQAGLGFFPSLFGLQFVSRTRRSVSFCFLLVSLAAFLVGLGVVVVGYVLREQKNVDDCVSFFSFRLCNS